MPRSVRLFVAALALTAACGPYLPPATVPPSPDPGYAPLQATLQAYIDQTQPYRKQAAQAGERVPGKTAPTASAETAVRTRVNALAEAVTTKLRPGAKQGDLLTPAVAPKIRKDMADAFAGLKHDLIVDALAEQNDSGSGPAPKASDIAVNQHADAPHVPPILLESLPALPKQLEWGFAGRTLFIRDVDADLVVDYLPDTLPEQAPATVPSVPRTPPSAAATQPVLPLPSIRGATVFGLIGDSGTGDNMQRAVADAMVAYFTGSRHFPFVLMLGDNLYDDDYTGEFLVPYKPLLDRGVTFYAAIGNHDKEPQIHFKPFNMNDRDYYSFDKGNARFAALNSNDIKDPKQLTWLDGVFADAGNKWRICFFHHPLYSSGQHADEARTSIRPWFEAALVRNRINVVFNGHDHLYERVAPQQGVRYFVSGGGGRKLYDVNRSPFDEVAVSEHHFMVVAIAGDRLFYEAITPAQKLLDCGLLWRTPDAAAKPPDKDTEAWLTACAAPRATQ